MSDGLEKRQLTWEEYRKIEAKEKTEREKRRFVISMILSCSALALSITALALRFL